MLQKLSGETPTVITNTEELREKTGKSPVKLEHGDGQVSGERPEKHLPDYLERPTFVHTMFENFGVVDKALESC